MTTTDETLARVAESVVQRYLGVSAEDRTLFVTRYIEKMELAEIADAIGRPLSTTKRRLARATRRISARMNGDAALADYMEGLATPGVGGVDRTGRS